jgi:hypothetical protein
MIKRLLFLLFISINFCRLQAQTYSFVKNINEEDSSILCASHLQKDGSLITASQSKFIHTTWGASVPGGSRFGRIDIRKLNSSFQEMWQYSIPKSVGRVMDIKTLSNGNILASGTFVDSLLVGPGITFYASEFNANAFLICLDQNGDLVWAKSRPRIDHISAYYKVFDEYNGNIYVPFRHYVGFKATTRVKVYNLAGDSMNELPLANENLIISEFEMDDEGNVYMAGTGGPTSDVGGESLGADTPFFAYLSFIAKLDSDFKQKWSHTFRYITFDFYPRMAFNDDKVVFYVDTMPQVNGAGNHHILKFYSQDGKDLHRDSVGGNLFSKIHQVMDIISVNDGFLFSTLKDFSDVSVQYVDSNYNYRELATIELSPGFFNPWFVKNDSMIYYSQNYSSEYLKANSMDSIKNPKYTINNYVFQQCVVAFSYENRTLSAPELEVGEIGLYPNPSNSHINLEFEYPVKDEMLNIYNAQGQLVQSKLVSSSNVTLDISHYAPGLYFVRIGSYAAVRFVKE